LQDPPKFTQRAIFGLKIYNLATLRSCLYFVLETSVCQRTLFLKDIARSIDKITNHGNLGTMYNKHVWAGPAKSFGKTSPSLKSADLHPRQGNM
jgi:hypothetical protein